MKSKKTQYGPVFITAGPYKGYIGEYDDDAYDDDGVDKAIVYFGHAIITDKYALIPHKFLDEVTTHRLMQRREVLLKALSPFSTHSIEGEERIIVLEEMSYIVNILEDRWYTSRLTSHISVSKIFISYSSKDKILARWISVDLTNVNHKVWLDEWQIRVGESIPKRIGQGLTECRFVVVLLSKHAVASRWVENEWHAKYWEEIEENRIKVLPVLIEDCPIPVLLKTKKYADFRYDYSKGLKDLLVAINSLSELKKEG